MPLLFGFPECSQTSKHLCDLPALKPGQFAVTRYENQEFQAAVQSTVAGEQCFLLGSIAPPECQMLTFLLLGHPLTKEGASLVTGILPYLAYSREGKLKAGQSLANAWMGGLLTASGFDEIWTIDLHSEQDKKLFPLPLESLSPSTIFHQSLAKLWLTSKLCVPRPGRHSALPGNEIRSRGNVWKNRLLRKASNRRRNCAPYAGWKGGAARGDRRRHTRHRGDTSVCL